MSAEVVFLLSAKYGIFGAMHGIPRNFGSVIKTCRPFCDTN